MGRPLVIGTDTLIAYPLVDYILVYFGNIHPNYITILGMIFKFLSIYFMYSKYYFLMFIFRLIERISDCLDGEVARVYNKRSYFGHLLDKLSDMICNIATIYCGLVIGYNNCKNHQLLLFHVLLYLSVPVIYLIDIISGRIPKNMSVTKDMYFIYIEDNSILLSLLIPLELYFLVY